MADKTFAKGIFVDTKTTQFGEIIKLSFKSLEFKQFLTEHTNGAGYVNIDILTNQEGKKYAVLNDYVKKDTTPPPTDFAPTENETEPPF